MKLLLDTHLLIWAAISPERLSLKARRLINSPENELFFSAASIWEIVIKLGLNRSDFKLNPRILRRGLLDNGYQEISITSKHTLALETLPSLHKDPFDRILISQATVEEIILLTHDDLLAKYSDIVKKI